MSNRDETDRAQSANDTISKAEQLTKPSTDEKPEQINGNSSNNTDITNNVTNSTNPLANDNADLTTKPSNPSNWVQFENDDDHDKVNNKRTAFLFNLVCRSNI